MLRRADEMALHLAGTYPVVRGSNGASDSIGKGGLLLVARRANKREQMQSERERREVPTIIGFRALNITLFVALLPLLLLLLVLGRVSSTTTTASSPRLAGNWQRDKGACSNGSCSIGGGSLSGRHSEEKEQTNDDYNDNQSAHHQSEHPPWAPPVVDSGYRQQQQQPSEAPEKQTIELYPSQLARASPLQHTSKAFDTTRRGAQRWWAFNKCNSSGCNISGTSISIGLSLRSSSSDGRAVVKEGGQTAELDKQLAPEIKGRPAAPDDNWSSLARFRRDADVGHRDGLAAMSLSSSRRFVGRHQTSFTSELPSRPFGPPSSVGTKNVADERDNDDRDGLFSWPRGEQSRRRRQLTPSSFAAPAPAPTLPEPLSIGEKAKRKRPSLEEPLIGFIGGGAHDGPAHQTVARGSAKVVVGRELTVAVTQEEDAGQEDEDDEEATDAEADNFVAAVAVSGSSSSSSKTTPPTKLQDSDNKGRHIQALTTNPRGAPDTRAETPAVRKIGSGQPAEFGLSSSAASLKVDRDRSTAGKDYHRTTEADLRYQYGEEREAEQQHRHQVDGSEDDQIISHYNLIELMDDDLFLARGSRVRHGSSSQHRWSGHRLGRSGGTENSGANSMISASPLVLDKMRTIYFGGFFPWLADEDTRLTDDGAAYATSGLLNNDNDSRLQTGHNKSGGATDYAGRRANNEEADGQELAIRRGNGNDDDDDGRSSLRSRHRKHQQQARRRKQHESVGGSQAAISLPQNRISSPTAVSALASMLPSAAPLSGSSGSENNYNNNNNNRHQLGRFILPAVRLALDHINTNSSILSTYKLEIVPRDTQVSSNEARMAPPSVQH